ncbi:hypothetical protein LSAT2_030920 [Lamellibrachia satsuma]|nr:hypothetical protein LSAT2_030920 [Lamellibrachia satsuma]
MILVCIYRFQACSYKIGELKIWELRRRAEKALGPAFDLRDFHEVLLHLGFAPLSLMEEETDNYIRRVKATSGEQKLTSAVLLHRRLVRCRDDSYWRRYVPGMFLTQSCARDKLSRSQFNTWWDD